MNTRNYIIAGLTTTLVLTMSALASAVGPTFSDLDSNHEHKAAIDYLQTEGHVEGYPDGTFRPDNSINRAEFLKIVLNTKGIQAGGTGCFPDASGNWFDGYVCKAFDLGFIDGYPDGLFHPERQILFSEASKIIANVMELETDLANNENWYHRYVVALENANAIPPRITDFAAEVNRGQMSEMVWRIAESPADIASNTYENIAVGKAGGNLVSESLVAFASCTELKDYLKVDEQRAEPTSLEFVEEAADSAPSAVSNKSTTSQASDDFSSTNIQVAGVDEADIVKNDGSHIFVLKGRTVRIIKAFPAENMLETAIINFAEDDEQFTPTDMYLDGDNLVVIGNGYEQLEATNRVALSLPEPGFYMPRTSFAKVFVIDVSDRTQPEVIKEVKLEGNVNSSRKIDDTVYLVSNNYEYSYITPYEEDDNFIPIPKVSDSKNAELTPAVGCDEVLYHPGGTSKQYIVVSAISLEPNQKTVSKTILGNSSGIYASRDNLYLTENTSNWYPFFRGGNSQEETVIHKFSLDPKEIDYKGKNKVPGRVLNQFSMDEYEGNFRVATTKGNIWDEVNKSTNNLYILDSELNRVGELTGIAPGEQIHSVRFMGGRAYMVTFKKVDPLFVIDVSEATNPRILGALKIPGFSDYLHPFDENHIIGFGLDTIEASEFEKDNRDLDFAWYQGVKIAMFDVSNVNEPKEKFVEIIGDRGTDTPLRWNHKALMFAPNKGTNGDALMALPIRLAEIDESGIDLEKPANTYGDYIGQYAYIYDVSAEDGFEFRDRITHYDDEQTDEYNYYREDKNINRIAYIGDYLYTISRAIIQAHGLSNLEEANSVELEDLGDEPNYYWY